MHSIKTLRKGFSLVELSIILVTIGLLIGGVMVGQSLVDSFKIQKTMTVINELHLAAQRFKQVYNYPPGDLPNAHSLFGAGCGVNAITSNISSNNNGCNGDGNGYINISNTYPAYSTNPTEARLFWMHLSEAGMLEKSNGAKYSRLLFTSATWDKPNFIANSPQIPLNETYLLVHAPVWDSNYTTQPSGSQSTYAFITVGGKTPGNIFGTPGPLIRQAMAIDTKMDDGHANKGIVRSNGSNACIDDTTLTWTQTPDDPDTESCVMFFFQPKGFQN